jgi:hypothetical protein
MLKIAFGMQIGALLINSKCEIGMATERISAIISLRPNGDTTCACELQVRITQMLTLSVGKENGKLKKAVLTSIMPMEVLTE